MYIFIYVCIYIYNMYICIYICIYVYIYIYVSVKSVGFCRIKKDPLQGFGTSSGDFSPNRSKSGAKNCKIGASGYMTGILW